MNSQKPFNMRSINWIFLLFACLTTQFHTTAQAAPPYPDSTVIDSLTWDLSSLQIHGSGSDQWPMTWADDDNVYAVYGDGGGWDGSVDQSMGITRIGGNPPGLSGTDLFGHDRSFNRKPDAIVADANQTMYLFYSSPNLDNWSGSWSAVSHDNGMTFDFSNTNKIFDHNTDGVRVVGIVQFGPGYTGIPASLDDSYYYVYLSGREGGQCDGKGKEIFLARVPKSQIFTRSAYEYISSIGSDNTPVWTSNFSAKQPVFYDPAGMEYHAITSYNPALNRFIFTKAHCTDNVGVWEAPTPWGPWGTVYYGSFQGKWIMTPMFPQKWMSTDGLSMWMSYGVYDDLRFIKANLTLANSSGDTMPPSSPSPLVVE